MSAEDDEQLGLESTQFISDITMEVITVKDDLQLLHIQDHNDSASNNCFTFSSLPQQQDDSIKDVNKSIPSSECEAAKNEEEDEEHKLNPVKKKLVSALKGSREKEGNSMKGKELSVTWAPDVYDPLPSAAQTFTKIKKLRPKKKNGKYKQRGKVDKGGSSSSSSSSKNKNKSKSKSMKPIQKQGEDDVRMWWQQEPLEEINDSSYLATGIRNETDIL